MDAQNHYNEIENLIKELGAGRRQYEKFQNIHIGQVDGQIEVSGYLSYDDGYRNIKEIPKVIAKYKLDEIKEKFELLLVQYDKLRTFMSNYPIDYYLVFDYGGGGAAVCAYVNGIYKEFI
jgi:hypothetical protein